MDTAETREERFKHALKTLISEARTPEDALVRLLGSQQCLTELTAGKRLPSLNEATLLGAFFGVSPAQLMQVTQPSLGVSLRLGTVEGIHDVTEAVRHASRLLTVDRLTRDWGFTEPIEPVTNFAPSKVWHHAQAGERTAARLRAYLGIDDLDPIEALTELVESLGYPVEYRSLPEDVHGISVPETRKTEASWVILINSNDYWSRQRFTLCHELCHVLQKDTGQVIVDRVGTPENGPERVANNFARHFLLTEDALEQKLSQYEFIDSPNSAARLISDLMLTYGISRDSLLISLRELRAEITRSPYFAYCEKATVSEIMRVSGNRELWDDLNAARGQSIPSNRLTQQVLNAYSSGLVSLQSVADVISNGDSDLARSELTDAGWPFPEDVGTARI
ncbi:ImmA/IrrE family metallo-endopeptidase [Streptomyces sp. D54]|uniref:ImmA/IrrE family metallo-endopeptidase n=1 Tax=Streptomyces sp. D54 TaxID=1290289 RepID=UPI003CF0AF64